jgi:hypothetical protein
MTPKIKIVHTSDIQRMLGVSVRTAQRRMKDIKQVYGKQNHQIITYTELVNYFGLNP